MKTSKNWKNGSWLDHRETGSSDWAWNEGKQGPEHAVHCKLWREIGATGKLWRVLITIKYVPILHPQYTLYTRETEGKPMSKSCWGTVSCLLYHYIKIALILIQGSVHNHGMTIKRFFKNKMFIYFCDLLLTKLLHQALYETETHKCIGPLWRHQEGTKFPAGPIRLSWSMPGLGFCCVYRAARTPHLRRQTGKSIEAGCVADRVRTMAMSVGISETPEQHLWCERAHCTLTLEDSQRVFMIRMCFMWLLPGRNLWPGKIPQPLNCFHKSCPPRTGAPAREKSTCYSQRRRPEWWSPHAVYLVILALWLGIIGRDMYPPVPMAGMQ